MTALDGGRIFLKVDGFKKYEDENYVACLIKSALK